MSSHPAKKRFPALDLLRGFFIVIIIVDHLSRWPSIFGLISGKGVLWATAAEGFVIISGLLVGYIRGFKAKGEKLRTISIILWKRALTLYVWAIIGSILYTAAIWYLPLIGGAPGMPIEKGEWGQLVIDSITLTYTFVWVYFLKLYAIFLAAAPLALWLLRSNKAWLVALISILIFTLGWIIGDEVMQWQIVFFIPVIAGYYMPTIQNWWHTIVLPKRRILAVSLIILTIATIILSAISTFLPQVSLILDRTNAVAFSKDSLSIWRVLIAFLWFSGYLLIFIRLGKYIDKSFGWLLRPIGTHSLTAYILHGIAIIAISYFTMASENVIVNSVLGAMAILTVWLLIKIPGINKVIPR